MLLAITMNKRVLPRAFPLWLLFLGMVVQGVAAQAGTTMLADRFGKLRPAAGDLRDDACKLKPLAQAMPNASGSDWLAMHPESGQTFAQYYVSHPVMPSAERSKIAILPLGNFNPEQERILATTAQYLGLYYGLEVEVLAKETPTIPDSARRQNPLTGQAQWLSTYFCNELNLLFSRPSDAAFTDV